MFEESIAVKSWIPWPEEDLCRYGSEMSGWKVFPLCSCIPSNNLENFKWIERCCTACPKTVAMLRNIVPLRYDAMSNNNKCDGFFSLLLVDRLRGV